MAVRAWDRGGKKRHGTVVAEKRKWQGGSHCEFLRWGGENGGQRMVELVNMSPYFLNKNKIRIFFLNQRRNEREKKHNEWKEKNY